MARTSEFSSSRPSGTTPRPRKSDLDASNSLDGLASSKPSGRSYSESMEWRHAAIFSAGVAIGALIGAGAALLYAPQSGEDTREMLSERAHQLGGRLGERIGDRIDDAKGDLGWYLRRGRRKLRRGAERGRWAGEDLADRVRRGF